MIKQHVHGGQHWKLYGRVVRKDAIIIGKGQHSIRKITTKIVNYNILKKIV
jgi:hypothetical protein